MEALGLFPLLGLCYEPGHIRDAALAIPDPSVRAAALIELSLWQGDFLRCIEESADSAGGKDLACGLTAELCRCMAEAALGDEESARAGLVCLMQEGERARELLGRLEPASLGEGSADTVCGLRTKMLAGDFAASEIGELHERQDSFGYLSTQGLSYAHRMLGCYLAAKGALSDGQCSYSAGILQTLVVTSRKSYPLLSALASLVLAVDCVTLGYDSLAKDAFMEGYGVLKADGLLAPLALAYRGLMGLPGACLQGTESASLKKIQALAGRCAYLGQLANRSVDKRASSALLNPRESSFAQLAALGRSNREIAAFLGTSTHTVKYHLSNSYAKLNIERRSDLFDAPDEG